MRVWTGLTEPGYIRAALGLLILGLLALLFVGAVIANLNDEGPRALPRALFANGLVTGLLSVLPAPLLLFAGICLHSTARIARRDWANALASSPSSKRVRRIALLLVSIALKVIGDLLVPINVGLAIVTILQVAFSADSTNVEAVQAFESWLGNAAVRVDKIETSHETVIFVGYLSALVVIGTLAALFTGWSVIKPLIRAKKSLEFVVAVLTVAASFTFFGRAYFTSVSARQLSYAALKDGAGHGRPEAVTAARPAVARALRALSTEERRRLQADVSFIVEKTPFAEQRAVAYLVGRQLVAGELSAPPPGDDRRENALEAGEEAAAIAAGGLANVVFEIFGWEHAAVARSLCEGMSQELAEELADNKLTIAAEKLAVWIGGALARAARSGRGTSDIVAEAAEALAQNREREESEEAERAIAQEEVELKDRLRERAQGREIGR